MIFDSFELNVRLKLSYRNIGRLKLTLSLCIIWTWILPSWNLWSLNIALNIAFSRSFFIIFFFNSLFTQFGTNVKQIVLNWCCISVAICIFMNAFALGVGLLVLIIVSTSGTAVRITAVVLYHGLLFLLILIIFIGFFFFFDFWV